LCAKITVFLFAVLLTLNTPGTAAEPSSMELRYIIASDAVIDVEVSINGDIYVLLPGLPHLAVYSADGSTSFFDLSEVLLPGGFFIDERWGWFVTGELTDIVCRYDIHGELAELFDSEGMPGDICLRGLSVLYVSRASGTINSLYQSDDAVAWLSGSGDGQLSSSGNEAVYSCRDESLLLRGYSVPESLPGRGTWTLAGRELMVLQDSCILDRNGTVIFDLPEIAEFTRISCSKDGNHCLLWSPGEGRILVLK
jgi:hypothetical protein